MIVMPRCFRAFDNVFAGQVSTSLTAANRIVLSFSSRSVVIDRTLHGYCLTGGCKPSRIPIVQAYSLVRTSAMILANRFFGSSLRKWVRNGRSCSKSSDQTRLGSLSSLSALVMFVIYFPDVVNAMSGMIASGLKMTW